MIAQILFPVILVSVIVIYLIFYFSQISRLPKLIGNNRSKFVEFIREKFDDITLKRRFSPLIYFWGTNMQTCLFGYLQGQSTSLDEMPRSEFYRQHLYISDAQYLKSNVDLSKHYLQQQHHHRQQHEQKEKNEEKGKRKRSREIARTKWKRMKKLRKTLLTASSTNNNNNNKNNKNKNNINTSIRNRNHHHHHRNPVQLQVSSTGWQLENDWMTAPKGEFVGLGQMCHFHRPAPSLDSNKIQAALNNILSNSSNNSDSCISEATCQSAQLSTTMFTGERCIESEPEKEKIKALEITTTTTTAEKEITKNDSELTTPNITNNNKNNQSEIKEDNDDQESEEHNNNNNNNNRNNKLNSSTSSSNYSSKRISSTSSSSTSSTSGSSSDSGVYTAGRGIGCGGGGGSVHGNHKNGSQRSSSSASISTSSSLATEPSRKERPQGDTDEEEENEKVQCDCGDSLYSNAGSCCWHLLLPQVDIENNKQQQHEMQREQLEFGQCALDWYKRSHKHYHTNKLVALISAGMTTGSEKKYVTDTVKTLDQLGYEVCVFIRRGVGGLKLSSTKFFSPAKWRDYEAAILSIKEQRPGARLVSIGFSFGSIELCRYLSMSGKRSQINAALLVSCPFDPAAGGNNMRKRILNRKIDAYLAKHLGKQLHQAMFNQDELNINEKGSNPNPAQQSNFMASDNNNSCPIPTIAGLDLSKGRLGAQNVISNYNGSLVNLASLPKVKSLADFESNYNRIIQNYPSVEAYATDCRLQNHLTHIRTPTLCLSSEDDFMAPLKLLPLEQIRANKNLCMILTKRGGHMAFIDGLLWPKKPYFAQRIIGRYMESVKVMLLGEKSFNLISAASDMDSEQQQQQQHKNENHHSIQMFE